MRNDLHNICIDIGINLKRECDLKKVILKTSNNLTIPYPISGFDCSGYFVAYPNLSHPLLGVALGIDINDLIPNIFHEWSHMDQWNEDVECWKNNMHLIDGQWKESVQIIDDWINGDKRYDTTIKYYIDAAIEVGIDCEKRAIKKLYDYHIEDKLKFTVDELIQKANSYLFSYLYIKESKCWNVSGKAPYLIQEVWTRFPTTFDCDYTILTEEYKELFKNHCYYRSKSVFNI